jgi:UPF0148 protein
MPQRKEDEIMAEFLLKGGKMLEKCCKTCGCPLFEYKGNTFCVVCAEYEQAADLKKHPPVAPLLQDNCGCSGTVPAPAAALQSPATKAIVDELSNTLLALCHRIKNEGDPDRCLALMDAMKIGTEALQILRQL